MSSQKKIKNVISEQNKKMKINVLNYKELKKKKAYIITKSDDNKLNYCYKKEEVINLLNKKLEFSIVNDNGKDSNKKYVFYYFDKKILIIIFQDYEILELNYEHLYEEENPNIIKIGYKEQNRTILKKLILLYALEKDFPRLISKKIEDEYDIRKYYLINRSIIEKFKNNHSFSLISKKLEGFNFSYKGFKKNLHILMENEDLKDIVKSIPKNNINNPIFKKEEKFFPYFNKIMDMINYPLNFILITEDLFNLFYNDFECHPPRPKEEFLYNALIGNNVLFIQNPNIKINFHTYKINIQGQENISLDYICTFSFKEEMLFYEEINKYIKDKSLESYFHLKNIDINNVNQFIDLKENEQIIGKYIFWKPSNQDTPETIEKREILEKNIDLLKKYNNFIASIIKLEESNIKLYNINKELEKNSRNFKYVKSLIIHHSHWLLIEESLFFKEIGILQTSKNEVENKEEERKIINNMIINKDNQIEDQFKHFIYFDKNAIQIISPTLLYSFINLDFIKELNVSPDTLDFLKEKENIVFKNKGKYYVYLIKLKKYFEINLNSDYFFIIDDPNSKEQKNKIKQAAKKEPKINKNIEIPHNKNLENIFEYLKKLVNDKEKKQNQLKDKLNNISALEKIYLVNKNWIDEFKKFYNYDEIRSNKIEFKNWAKSINSKKEFPKNLFEISNLLPETFKYLYLSQEIANKFEIIDKEIFDSILTEINTRNNTNLKLDNIYKASYCDNRIYIEDAQNDKLYFIYSINNSEYILDYIIQFETSYDITIMFNDCENNETLEEILYSKYNMDFMKIENQILVDENMVKMGDFYNMRQNKNFEIKEPEHCLGLENIGATCYMNATIQCLCNVKNLKKYFLNKQSVYQDTNNKSCPLTLEFYKLINHLWKKSYNGKNYYTPTDFKNKISSMNSLFKGIAANDSKDLILFLYETMHSEINNPEYTNYKNQIIPDDQELQDFRNDYYPKNSSLFSKIFYFEQQSELKCMQCNQGKTSYNIHNIIIFPLEKVREYMVKKSANDLFSVKLIDCFEQFQDKEILGGNNQIYCNICNQMADASNGNKLFTSPEVMTIVLNRGKGIEFDVNFEYPLRINIDKYILDKECKNNDYELIGVLSHIGPSGMSGHFIAICKSSVNKKWYVYNDAMVSTCHDPRFPENMINGMPYVLFYQKIDKEEKDKDIKINDDKKDMEVILTLYFEFQDSQKEIYLDINKDELISKIIKDLNNKYDMPTNYSLQLKGDNNNLISLDNNKKIKDYPEIKNDSKLLIISN